MNVCLGGSFDHLHKGHKALIQKALQIAGTKGSVFIGLTADTVALKKGENISFKQRKETIEQFLSENNTLNRVSIQPLFDIYGPSIQGDFDAIVVSPETKPTAQEINLKRKQCGKKPLRIIIIPYVLAEDNQPISSTRIRKKEIDENGILLRKE